MINHPLKSHYSMLATKKELLKFIKKIEIVTVNDLVDHFGYKLQSAGQSTIVASPLGTLTILSQIVQRIFVSRYHKIDTANIYNIH